MFGLFFCKHNQKDSKTSSQRMSKIGLMGEKAVKFYLQIRNHNNGLERRGLVPHPVRAKHCSCSQQKSKGWHNCKQGRGTMWTTTMPPPRVKSVQQHAECYDTYLTVTPEQFVCKLYGQNICRKYQKNKNIWGLISHNTPHKCQHNLITISVCAPAQN